MYSLIVRHILLDGHEQDFDQLVTEALRSIREREPGTLIYVNHSRDGAVNEPLSAPSTTGAPQNLSVTGSSTATGNPGLYSSISVTGKASLNLSPGAYVVTGSITLSGSSSLYGSGVTIYLACSTYPNPCVQASPGARISPRQG